MFSGITSYLFGATAGEPSSAEAPLQETEIANLTGEGDDWILIDCQQKAAGASGSSNATQEDMSYSEGSSSGMSSGSSSSDEDHSPAPKSRATDKANVPQERSEPGSKKTTNVKQEQRKKLAKPAGQRKAAALAMLPDVPDVENVEPSVPGPFSYAKMAAAPAKGSASAESEPIRISKPAKAPALIIRATGSGKKKSNKHGTMEGSWFVTPPPCFTRPNTFMMESSPLEDILIEHPSISVYSPRPQPSSSESDSPMSASRTSDSSSVAATEPAVVATPSSSPPPPAVVEKKPVGPKQGSQAPTAPVPQASEQSLMPAKARKRRPQLRREPMQEMTSNCLVQLVPKRSERKARKQSRKEAKESEKKAAELRRPSTMTPSEASAHAGKMSRNDRPSWSALNCEPSSRA